MNYCSYCGSDKIAFKKPKGDVHERFICSSCKVIHYSNPNIVTGCLPIWEDKVLLAMRAIGPRKGYWNVPAGFMENGETVEEGALREVWEETETKVEIEGLVTLYSIPHINQVYMHFYGKMLTPDFACGIESSEVQLFKEEEIPWDKIAFTSSTFTLQHYFADRKKGIHELHRGYLDL
jgi:ADP-ribose pyrophosphatase YjhB (NUDIX family)